MAKCFYLSSPLNIAQERACALSNIWSHVRAEAGSKGIIGCGSNRVCVRRGTLLHFQASALPDIHSAHAHRSDL